MVNWLEWIFQEADSCVEGVNHADFSCQKKWRRPQQIDNLISAMNTGGGSFPLTDWGLLANLQNQTTREKRAALDVLIRRYWKPVYLFLRRFGYDEETAKDLTQSFFMDWMEKDNFAKADPQKGRFRTFMLTCLKRYTANVHRADQAARRRPEHGFVSLQEMLEQDHVTYEPADHETPESLFNQAWARETIMRVLGRLEEECRRKGQVSHYDILLGRVVDPLLNGAEQVPTRLLAEKYNLTEKQVFNHLETVKRAYRQLMREEVGLYALSGSEISEEVNDLLRMLGKNP